MRDEFKERLGAIELHSRIVPRRKTTEIPSSLEDLPGVVRTDGVLIVERSLGELTSGKELRSLLARLSRASRGLRARGNVKDEVRALIEKPEQALFFDTVTMGLGGSMVFMLGVMRVYGADVRLSQVFARDYREERELLDVWVDMLAGSSMLVSFNGKSFDMPMLRDRLGLHGITQPSEPPHLDLLHHARRRWRKELPDCRLQTLEWKICGRRRSGDIPGEEIPAVYHRFVRTGEARDMLTVFHHNALDLITLADIAVALSCPVEGSS